MNFVCRAAVALATLALVGAGTAMAQEIKPGKWEYSMQMDMGNMPQMPKLTPEQLAKMPPEARARVEQMMQGHGMTFSSCITGDKPVPTNPQHRNCAVEKMERSGGNVTWKATCTSPEGRSSKIEATAGYTGDKMAMDMMIETTGRDGRPMTMKQHMTGRYLGPCGG